MHLIPVSHDLLHAVASVSYTHLNLAEMTSLGLPVPQGFTITTEACTQYYEDGREINDEIQGQINEYIVKMEEITGKKFGDKENPLLVSVRSGARASMPGMMLSLIHI